MTVAPATLFVGLAVLVSLVMAAMALAVSRGAKSGWIDAVWSFLVGAAGIAAALVPVDGWEGDPLRRFAVAAVAATWSLRLGLHIAARTLHGGEDPRYAALIDQWGEGWRGRMFGFLQIQAGVAFLLATTIFLAARNPTPSPQWSDFAGIALLAAAIAGEGIADAQLARFRRDPANRGKVCDVGLWGLSRHPNYFFQWLGRTGYAVVAIGPCGDMLWGWAALAGPIFMYWLLTRASGIPPLEEHMMRSRGQPYADYRKRVNAFWPGPQR